MLDPLSENGFIGGVKKRCSVQRFFVQTLMPQFRILVHYFGERRTVNVDRLSPPAADKPECVICYLRPTIILLSIYLAGGHLWHAGINWRGSGGFYRA